MKKVFSARLGRTYLRELPNDVRRMIEAMGIGGEWNREREWRRVLDRGSYTAIKDWSPQELVLTCGRMAFQYDRDPGRANSKFLEGLRRGKLVGTMCNICKRTLLPPRVFCEWCFRDINRWVELPSLGEVATYSLSYMGTDPRERRKEPLAIAVVWLEGTKITRPSSRTVVHAAGLLHFLGEVKPEEVRIGMKVKAVWKPKTERIGSILDIKYFAPVR